MLQQQVVDSHKIKLKRLAKKGINNNSNFFYKKKKIIERLLGLMMKKGELTKSFNKLRFLIVDLKGYRRSKNINLYFLTDLLTFLNSIEVTLSLRNRRVAGQRYKVPYLIDSRKSLWYVFKWFSQEIKDRTRNKKLSRCYFLNSVFSVKELDVSSQGKGFLLRRLQNHNKEVLEHRSSTRFT